MCRCKYNKANTNTCHVMWLVRVVLFKDYPASLIVLFTLPLKKKVMFCTKALATDPFSSTADFDFTIDFEEAFIRNPSNQKKTLVSPMEPASRTSHVEPAWRIRFIAGFKFICSARSMGNIFTVQISIIYINIGACKICVITRARTWMGSRSQNLDPWLPNIFPGIAKKKGKVYATKRYHYLLMTRLACDQLGTYFLCYNHVPVIKFYAWEIQHFSKSGVE